MILGVPRAPRLLGSISASASMECGLAPPGFAEYMPRLGGGLASLSQPGPLEKRPRQSPRVAVRTSHRHYRICRDRRGLYAQPAKQDGARGRGERTPHPVRGVNRLPSRSRLAEAGVDDNIRFGPLRVRPAPALVRTAHGKAACAQGRGRRAGAERAQTGPAGSTRCCRRRPCQRGHSTTARRSPPRQLPLFVPPPSFHPPSLPVWDGPRNLPLSSSPSAEL